MTKETYIEMCKSMNMEIEEDKIPPEYQDLTFSSHDAITLFNYLPDKFDGFTGKYLGKDITNIVQVLTMLEIDKNYWLLILELLNIIIEEKINFINNKIDQEVEASGKQHNKNIYNKSR